MSEVPLTSEPGEEFALSDIDADHRYRIAIDTDPFPKIPAALLNSADVEDYVRATGMIFPFDRSCLKACSYKVSIGSRCLYWDEKGKEGFRSLEEGEGFTLPPNAIVFVTTKEFFRLPRYIAARFNLSITNVHRGILLGTGPLVDPGFWGRLLIPLHNLTLNEYNFQSGESFAWFEFTKVSPNYWDPTYERDDSRLRGIYKAFDPKKSKVPPEHYLRRAHPTPIRSSIPDALDRSAKSAEDARDENRKLRNIVSTLGALALIAAAYGGYQLVLSSNQRFDGIMHSMAELQRELGAIGSQIDHESHPGLEAQLEAMGRQVDTLARTLGSFDPLQTREQIDELRNAISGLEREVNELQEQSDR